MIFFYGTSSVFPEPAETDFPKGLFQQISHSLKSINYPFLVLNISKLIIIFAAKI